MSNSMREALEAAFDGQNEEQEQPEGKPAESSSPPGAEEVGGPEAHAEESVRTTEQEEAEAPDTGGEAPDKTAKSKPSTEVVGGEAEPPAEKAPASWKAAVREEWSKLPPTVRQEVLRREKDVNNILQQTAQQRHFIEDFQNTVGPYEQLIRSQNSTPLKAVGALLQTAAGLTMGSPQQKATIIKNLIGEYAVDINTLDNLLVGEAPGPEIQQQDALARMLDERLKPVQTFMQTLQQREQGYVQTMEQQADSEINEFAKSHDFFEDVRTDMADFIDMARARQQSMTLDEAYERAVYANPEIRKLVMAKEAQRNAAENAQRIAGKQAAASSVRSAGQAPNTGAPANLRDAIEQAWGGE